MISKLNNFPALLEMEVKKGEDWQLMISHYCNNKEALYKKMETLKSLYVVSNREYRIFITYQSKVNRYLKRGEV
jgi:hypothetical protein